MKDDVSTAAFKDSIDFLLTKYFKRFIRKENEWRDFSASLLMVMSGLRGAYVSDYFLFGDALQMNTLESFVNELKHLTISHENQRMSCLLLIVVRSTGAVFFTTKDHVRSLHFPQQRRRVFVDINSELSHPELCTHDVGQSVTESMSCLFQKLEEKEIVLFDDWPHFTTVAGWLLEYPIIYYYSKITEENCLSMVELTRTTYSVNFIVHNQYAKILSVCCPTALLREPGVAQSIEETTKLLDERLLLNKFFSNLKIITDEQRHPHITV